MGITEKVASFVVRRHCLVFWASIIISLVLGVGGVALMITPGFGQGKIFADPGEYDWLVTGSLTVDQMDMVRLAREAAEVDDDGNFFNTTMLSEQAQSNHTTTFMYYWKESERDDEIFTPETLRQMCEVENVLLGTDGYGEVCFNNPETSFKTTVNGTECAVPRLSAVSLFYVPWESVAAAAAEAATTSPSAQRVAELYAGKPFSGGYTNMPLAASTSFWSAGAHTRDCVLLDAQYVAERAAWLYAVAQSGDVAARAIFGFYVSPDALDRQRTRNTRSQIPLGAPVANASGALVEPWKLLKHEEFAERVRERLFEYFGMETAFLRSPWRTPAETADLDVRFLSSVMINNEFNELMNSDFLMVIGSMAFVLIYICFHTGSFALGMLGMLMIILSLPCSIFFYVLFRVQYFAMIHILAVFIVLGIGADDIFVFADAWRQSASMGPAISGSLTRRMNFAYSRTAQAVFNTSFTTAVAFIATGVSPVMPVAAFGYYAAIAILMNYFLAISFLPAAFVIWEVRFRKARCVGCCFPCVKPCALAPVDIPMHRVADAEKGGATADKPELDASAGNGQQSRLEKLFSSVYAPALNVTIPRDSKRGYIKPVSIACVLGLSVLGAILASEAVQLSAPTKEESFFPPDHMVTGFGDRAQTDYLTGSNSQYLEAGIYIGIKDVTRADYSRWIPGENRGTIVFDDNFDLSTAAAQASFKQLCEEVKVAECASTGCNKVPNRLVDPASVVCLLNQFEAWNGGPEVGANFESRLQEWVELAPATRGELAGFVDGELKFVQITFTATLLELAPPYVTREVYDEWQIFIDEFLLTVPPELASCDEATDRCTLFVYGGYAFAWMVTQEQLVSGLFSGLGICAPVAFVVLLFATGNLLVSLYAILTIFLVVISLLGTCNLIGFELGISEAIAGTIVIGLAVDYTVHLGHVYTEALEPSRGGKMATAASVMGVTVVAGGLTTFGCAAFMFACQLTFFTKMATLIGGTIGFSVLYSLFFFMPLLALLGPSGKMNSTAEHCRRLYPACKGKAEPAPPRAIA